MVNTIWRYCGVFVTLAPLYKTLDLLTYDDKRLFPRYRILEKLAIMRALT